MEGRVPSFQRVSLHVCPDWQWSTACMKPEGKRCKRRALLPSMLAAPRPHANWHRDLGLAIGSLTSPCARRLDVMPGTVHKFRSHGDETTAQLLQEVIYKVLLCPGEDAMQPAAAEQIFVAKPN